MKIFPVRVGNAGSRVTSVSICNERKIILKPETRSFFSNTKHKVCIHSDGNLISCQIVVVPFNHGSSYKSRCKTGSEASSHIVICILKRWNVGLMFPNL